MGKSVFGAIFFMVTNCASGPFAFKFLQSFVAVSIGSLVEIFFYSDAENLAA